MHLRHLSENHRGILAMSLAMACFIGNDALVKQASLSLPGPQLIFIRGLFATFNVKMTPNQTGSHL